MDKRAPDHPFVAEALRSLGKATIRGAAVVIAVLIVLLFIGDVSIAFRAPIIWTFKALAGWASLIANLLVVFYCFPAFRITRQRAFLYLAFAGLSFAYSTLFSRLFGASASARELSFTTAHAVLPT